LLYRRESDKVNRGQGFQKCGFFNKATAYTPGQIFTQNTSNDDYLFIFGPLNFPTTAIKLPLIVMVAA